MRKILIFAIFLALLCIDQTTSFADAAEPLRLGMAGLVHGHARRFFDRVRARDDLKIVGVYEAGRDLSDQYAKRYKLDSSLFHTGLEEMLDSTKPDAVVVYTSTRDHLAVVKACAARKIPVMMEKPLALDLEQARIIADEARKAGIPVLVNYETTWYRSNHAAFDVAHAGSIGEIRKMIAHDGHRGPKEIGSPPEFLSWITDPQQSGGGALMDFGCYGANLITWFMDGQRPLSVTAVTQSIKPDVYPKVEDEATIILAYPRAQGIIEASWNWPFQYTDLEVYGKTGTAFTVQKDQVRVRLGGKSAKETSTAKPLAAPNDDPLSFLMAVVRKQIPPTGPSSLEINLVTMEILDAAKRSAQTGKTVVLEKQ